jgi:DNA-directed RNA polymerase sigma subunit (sigma70/sigma32)
MATNKHVPPFKLSKTQKKYLSQFLMGEATITATAQAMNMTYQRVYTMASALTRHASSTGLINLEELLKNY